MTNNANVNDKNNDYYGNCRAIIIKDGRMVTMHRVKKGREFYVLPGGHKDNGENDYQCVTREVMEEFGIEVKPIKTLYECRFNGLNQCYILCEWISGDIHVTDGEEYHRMTEDNQYYPTSIDVSELSAVDLKPTSVRDALIEDINVDSTLNMAKFRVVEINED